MLRVVALAGIVLYMFVGGAWVFGREPQHAFEWASTIVLLLFMLYAFSDIDAEMKRRTLAILRHVSINLASLEGRMSSGRLRTEAECEEEMQRHAGNLLNDS